MAIARRRIRTSLVAPWTRTRRRMPSHRLIHSRLSGWSTRLFIRRRYDRLRCSRGAAARRQRGIRYEENERKGDLETEWNTRNGLALVLLEREQFPSQLLCSVCRLVDGYTSTQRPSYNNDNYLYLLPVPCLLCFVSSVPFLCGTVWICVICDRGSQEEASKGGRGPNRTF